MNEYNLHLFGLMFCCFVLTSIVWGGLYLGLRCGVFAAVRVVFWEGKNDPQCDPQLFRTSYFVWYCLQTSTDKYIRSGTIFSRI